MEMISKAIVDGATKEIFDRMFAKKELKPLDYAEEITGAEELSRHERRKQAALENKNGEIKKLQERVP